MQVGSQGKHRPGGKAVQQVKRGRQLKEGRSEQGKSRKVRRGGIQKQVGWQISRKKPIKVATKAKPGR
jgi:hypothetical protein